MNGVKLMNPMHVASWLQICGIPAKYIYRLHKLKDSMSVHLQKVRTAHIFQQLMWPPFFSIFFSALYPGIISM